MALPIEFYIYVGYGLFAILVSIAALNWLLGGLLKPFFAVKRARGSKILVRVRNPVQDYFRAGHVEEGFLIFKDRQKVTRRIPMIPGVVSRAATVFWVEVDDEKNCLFRRDTGEAVATYDAVRVDNYIVRALTKPNLLSDQMIKFVLILVVIVLIALLITAFLTYKNGMAIKEVLEAVKGVSTTVAAQVI